VLFSAHSVPAASAASSPYQAQLAETARLVAERAGHPDWQLVYQSRSGPPTSAWLEPDVVDVIRALPDRLDAVVVAPIGFLSDHMEVVYDLDTQARAAAEARGLRLVRAATPGLHPRFARMVTELVRERTHHEAPLRLGTGPASEPCRSDCCQGPVRPPPVDLSR
jgi:ferrochelatase